MMEVWLTKSGGWSITNNTPISGIISIEYSTAKSASYSGKTLSILGDSISTYAGYIPSGQSAFYDGTNCGVSSVDQTWWKRIINSLDMTLNLNNSWGGGRVSKTRSTYTEESSGIYRADKLGTDPDVIITYLGINDFNGEVSKAVFKSSYETMLDNMKTAYPNAEIFCATLPPCERNGSTGDPEINDDGVALTEYNDIIREVILEKGVKLLDFANCGITYNTLSQYMGDWESATGRALHPNSEGHRLIAQKAIRDMFD
uniref:Carboxyl esterase family II protein n=1 Tax=unidentified microorganism TaxID=81726 RepID=Q2YI86_9ZZZZ|nr:carboxyl esterase family II protein [unidentified microorganism]